jgi:hypothetical protein
VRLAFAKLQSLAPKLRPTPLAWPMAVSDGTRCNAFNVKPSFAILSRPGFSSYAFCIERKALLCPPGTNKLFLMVLI